MNAMHITITKRDGTKEPFDADHINRSIERACRGLSNITEKVAQIGSETQLTLYDGVTTHEMDEATINAALQNVKDDIEYDKVATRLLLKGTYKEVLGDYDVSIEVEEVARLHKALFAQHIQKSVEQKLLDPRMAELYDLEELAGALDTSRDEYFIYSGLSTLLHRYTMKAAGELPFETPQFFFMRVAMGMALNEEDPMEHAKVFYQKMSRLEYLAGGSTNIGAGTINPALSNCFLIEMQDDMDHIAKTIADILKISKATGGIGVSLTQLRATGSQLVSSNTKSSGPVPFAKIIDVSIRAIIRGGKKKGACALYMEAWHFDFLDFIEWRHNAGDDHVRMRTANTAAMLPDDFMRRVKNNEYWYCFDPQDTRDLIELYGSAFSKRYQYYVDQVEAGEIKVFKKMKATELYRKILVALQTTSHPWLIWKGSINNRALNNNTGTIHMSNLCTEICLPQDRENIAVCNLASLNISRHIDMEKGEIVWQKLEHTVRTMVRHLDNLVDLNRLPVPEAEKSDKENRAVGLGVMGVADICEKMKIAYDSEEAYDLMDRIFEFVSYMAIDESANLAQERGSYQNFAGSRWSEGMVPIDTLAIMEADRGVPVTVDKSSKHGGLDWDTLRAKVKKGMRNATLMAVAPNANIGLVAGTTPGIDVRFAQAFSRKKFSGKYLDLNHNLVKELISLDIWDTVKSKIIEHQGDISEIAEIPDAIKNVYKTSFSTSPYGVLEIAARAQKWIDQAISRNMYLETRNIDEMMRIYTYGWEKGIKTTYYLHMKPRHTAEQSTVKVNKGAALGKRGFAALKKEPVAFDAPDPAILSSGPKEAVIHGADDGANMCPVDPALLSQCDSCQ
ncbi:MAG: ribonucleoside-diphosphate reductase alpha chain [Planctomycetota bacterium]|jgi:ribonucleoside-diphosphate reductase alpha chain